MWHAGLGALFASIAFIVGFSISDWQWWVIVAPPPVYLYIMPRRQAQNDR